MLRNVLNRCSFTNFSKKRKEFSSFVIFEKLKTSLKCPYVILWFCLNSFFFLEIPPHVFFHAVLSCSQPRIVFSQSTLSVTIQSPWPFIYTIGRFHFILLFHVSHLRLHLDDNVEPHGRRQKWLEVSHLNLFEALTRSFINTQLLVDYTRVEKKTHSKLIYLLIVQIPVFERGKKKGSREDRPHGNSSRDVLLNSLIKDVFIIEHRMTCHNLNVLRLWRGDAKKFIFVEHYAGIWTTETFDICFYLVLSTIVFACILPSTFPFNLYFFRRAIPWPINLINQVNYQNLNYSNSQIYAANW